jgi:ribosomal protein L11 methyltransferase
MKPARVGKSFWVTPPWLKAPKFRRRRIITIEPGMAFGTGTHATTRCCMEFLEVVAAKLAGKSWSVLDVGTGSGILAIASRILGATTIWAIDNDPVAVEVARENLRSNGLANQVVLSNKPLSSIKRTFTVLVANLTAETILELADALEKRVAPGGYMVLSGILRSKAGAVLRGFEREFSRPRASRQTRMGDVAVRAKKMKLSCTKQRALQISIIFSVKVVSAGCFIGRPVSVRWIPAKNVGNDGLSLHPQRAA